MNGMYLRPGAWIEIVEPAGEEGETYKVGDRFEIDVPGAFGGVYVKGMKPYPSNKNGFLRDDEFKVIIDDLDSIKEELESARNEMNQLGEAFGLMHEQVIAASQRLDALLNRYEALRKKE